MGGSSSFIKGQNTLTFLGGSSKKKHPVCQPIQYHERTGHILPPQYNQLQMQVNRLKLYAKSNGMIINEEKTKVMLFNRARKIDFLPYIEISQGNQIEVVDEIKSLGIII